MGEMNRDRFVSQEEFEEEHEDVKFVFHKSYIPKLIEKTILDEHVEYTEKTPLIEDQQEAIK